ncbi:MAG: transglutaminase family protein [Pseudomonadota bacterium]
MRAFVVAVFLVCLTVAYAAADIADDLRAIIADDAQHGDLARTKLAFDRLIDPSIDTAAAMRAVDKIVADVRQMTLPGASNWDIAQILRMVIYAPGPWNENRPFAYDHDDPLGLQTQNRLLSDYLKDRRGNCITMPFLFLIAGERLGLDMTAGLAPLHVFVRFTDDAGVTHNLEATSGAGRTRDSHYLQHLPMTDRAIESGIYLRSLTREELVAVMAVSVAEHLMDRGRHQEALETLKVILSEYPQYAYAMVKQGTAAYHLIQSEFRSRYPRSEHIPRPLWPRLQHLQTINQTTFDAAEALGWRPFKP